VVGERTRITRGGKGINWHVKNPANNRSGKTNGQNLVNETPSGVLAAAAIFPAHIITRKATPICISAAGHGYTAPSAKGVKITSITTSAVRIRSSDRNRPLTG
jgi:hypothetical protein